MRKFRDNRNDSEMKEEESGKNLCEKTPGVSKGSLILGVLDFIMTCIFQGGALK